jgi:hypothetical protein
MRVLGRQDGYGACAISGGAVRKEGAHPPLLAIRMATDKEYKLEMKITRCTITNNSM